MNAITSLIFVSIAIAFVATLISGLIKLVFFFKQKDTYRHILKYALLGEIFGLLLMGGVWIFFRNASPEAENMIAIPFWFMLFGQVVGTIVTYSNKLKT